MRHEQGCLKPIRRPRAGAFLRDEKGAIAVMGAIFLVLIAGTLALAVDSASLFVEKRRAQGAVDLAAIAAARDIAQADAAAQATIADNSVPQVKQIVLATGNYTADPAVPPLERFRPNALPLNAAQVELHNRAPIYFARMFLDEDSLPITTRATAVASAAAAFSIGSRLLSLNGGVLNALLGRMLGGNVSLTAMDYNALAGLNVDLFRFSDALSTKINGNVGTYDELVSADASVRDVIDALAEVARDTGGGSSAAIALQGLGNSTNAHNLPVPIGQIVNFGNHGSVEIGQGGSAFAVRASALSILTTAAQIANGTRQVEVVSKLSLPGLLGLTVGITIGERPQSSPWIGIGERDVRVYTAQTRVRLLAEAGGSGLLSSATIRLPVFIDLASAEARLASVTCGANPSSDARVTLDVRPAVMDAWIGEPANPSGWTNFSVKPSLGQARLVSVAGLIEASGRAQATITNLRDEQVTFDWSDIAAMRAKTVRTRDFTSSLVNGLAENLILNVKAGPLTLLTPALLGKLVLGALMPAAKIVDGVLNDLLGVLGVGLGEADTWVHGVRCDGAVLVN